MVKGECRHEGIVAYSIKLYTRPPQAMNRGEPYFTTRFPKAGDILQEVDC